MFLRKFTLISEQGKVIREVVFKKGMNIILGETTSGGDGSTNSVGKTTLIRSIDFCLGGKLDTIYKDQEMGSANSEVEQFLTTVKPTFKLVLSRSFDSKKEITIERKVDLSLKRNKIKNKVDGEIYNGPQFTAQLKSRIFNFQDEKPTLRQLTGKFIRSNEYQISQILRFNGYFCSDAEYEKIHLFLLGFDSSSLLSEKFQTEQSLQKIEKRMDALSDRLSHSALEQKLHILREELNDLSEQRDQFKINDKYEKESAQLEHTQLTLNNINTTLADLRLKNHISLERIEKLRLDRVNLSSGSLSYLYEEAGYYSKKLSKTFDELVSFHNTMVANEIEYLDRSIKNNANEISELESSSAIEFEKYNDLLSFFGKSGSLAEYTKLNDRISATSKEIGESEALLNELIYHEKEFKELNEKLGLLNTSIQEKIKHIDKNLLVFNKFFSDYTQQLDGEKYLLSYKINDSFLYKFSIDNINLNPGSGLKQAIVAAFDLAYISFCNELKLKRPSFATTDKVEIIDIEKLKILINIANSLNGQYLAPFIRDKLDSIFDDIKDDIVLTLDKDDKFFNIENFPSNLAKAA